MKRNIFLSLLLVSCTTIAACALPSDISALSKNTQNIEDAATPTTNAPNIDTSEADSLTANEKAILALIQKKKSEGLSESEYLELSSLYSAENMIKDERDLLEEAYRLFGDEDTFSTLQSLCVNLSEEDAAVTTLTKQLLDYLSSVNSPDDTEAISDAITLLESPEWWNTLMPVLYEGKRTYYFEDGSQTVLIIEAGYDENGVMALSAYSLSQNKKSGTYLFKNGNIFDVYIESSDQVLTISDIASSEGKKDFYLCSIDFNKGTIRKDIGSVSNGVIVGDLTVSISQFDDYNGIEAINLFSSDDLTSVKFSGSFDENGVPTCDTPSASTLDSIKKSTESENIVVYAYNEDKSKCLYIDSVDDTSTFTFLSSYLELKAVPEIKVYSPKTTLFIDDSDTPLSGSLEEVSSIKVRVYNNAIQYFDGTSWITLGSVDSFVEKDPFKPYNDRHENVNTISKVITKKNMTANNIGTVVADKKVTTSSGNSNKTNSGSRTPAASTPTTPTVPVVTPAAPVVTPTTPSGDNGSANNNQSGSDSGSSSSGNSTPSAPAVDNTPSSGSSDSGNTSSGSDSGSSDAGSSSSGGSDSGSSGDGENIEWTPDDF